MTTTALQVCSYCSGFHSGVCPRVKSIEYYPNGTISKVEFHLAAADASATVHLSWWPCEGRPDIDAAHPHVWVPTGQRCPVCKREGEDAAHVS